MHQYKMVFSDIDGTLLTSNHKVTENTKKVIGTLSKEGIPFVLVSARMPSGMSGIRDEIGRANPMICYSGGLIVDEKEKTLYSAMIDSEIVQEIYHYVRGYYDMISFNIYSGDCWKVESEADYWVKQESDITGIIPHVGDFVEERSFQDVHKVLCMGEPEQISELEKELLEQYPEISIYKSKPTYLEIMSKKATKAGAMKFLQDTLEIKQEECVAFGDNYNDMSMLSFAGLGIAVGNAVEDVKNVADQITLTNDEEGVCKALESLFQIEV